MLGDGSTVAAGPLHLDQGEPNQRVAQIAPDGDREEGQRCVVVACRRRTFPQDPEGRAVQGTARKPLPRVAASARGVPPGCCSGYPQSARATREANAPAPAISRNITASRAVLWKLVSIAPGPPRVTASGATGHCSGYDFSGFPP